MGPFLPQEEPEIPGVDGVSFPAGIGFDPPLEVFAAPRGKPMASCRIPQKADRHAEVPLEQSIAKRTMMGANDEANDGVGLAFGFQHVRDQLVG